MQDITFGLLPLYLELYDRVSPQARERVVGFYQQIVRAFEARGFHPLTTEPCRLAPEFEQAVKTFESRGACAIVTLHLAYSPSLESINALTAGKLPIVILDTTPSPSFGPAQDPARIMDNHGIHGVQDMCNLLLRNRKKFVIEAGHWEQSDVIDRVCDHLRAAAMAAALGDTRTGLIGEAFEGMGDFSVSDNLLQTMTGHPPCRIDPRELTAHVEAVSDDDVAAEMQDDHSRFDTDALDPLAHRRATIAALALRRWIEDRSLDAFSINFLHVTRASGLPVMPFLGISKAMARGLGYAGEGDLLTAAFVSMLARCCSETTFTEMFCPDWEGNRIFLSHMGEVNLDLLAGTPKLVCRRFPYTDAEEPVIAAGCMKSGPCALVNLAPMPDDGFCLIVAPGAMTDAQEDRFTDTVHGWFQPTMPVSEFLARYSRLGGTHHGALVYDLQPGVLLQAGNILGWRTHIIGP